MKAVSVWALAKIEPQNENRKQVAVAQLVASLRSDQPQLRHAALRGLADLQPTPEAALPAMSKALQDNDKSVAERGFVRGGVVWRSRDSRADRRAETQGASSRRGKDSRPNGIAGEGGGAGLGRDRQDRPKRSIPERGPDGLGGDRRRPEEGRSGGDRSPAFAAGGRPLCGLFCPGADWQVGGCGRVRVADKAWRFRRMRRFGGLGAGANRPRFTAGSPPIGPHVRQGARHTANQGFAWRRPHRCNVWGRWRRMRFRR